MDKTIIVTVHGIEYPKKPEDDWQKLFTNWLKVKYNNYLYGKELVHESFSYGWLNRVHSWVIKIIDWVCDAAKVPNLVTLVRAKKFRNFLRKVANQYPDSKIHIVAHSFGTFVVCEALLRYSSLRVQSLNLVAGVVSSRLSVNSLDTLLERNQVKRIDSWSSYSDRVVKYLALWPFGHVGYWGFLRPNHPKDKTQPQHLPFPGLKIYNNHTAYSHTGYFKDEDAFYPRILANIFKAETYA